MATHRKKKSDHATMQIREHRPVDVDVRTTQRSGRNREDGHTQPLYPFILLFFFLFAWFMHADDYIDPWYEILNDIDNVKTSNDVAMRSERYRIDNVKLQELSRRYPYHARLHYLLGYSYLLLGEYDSTRIQAKECMRLDSCGIVNQVASLALICYRDATIKSVNKFLQEKKTEAARNLLWEAMRIDPNQKQIFKAVANMHAYDKKYDSAEYFFNMALQIDSTEADVYRELATIAIKRNDLFKARICLQNVLKYQPTNEEARALLMSVSAAAPR